MSVRIRLVLHNTGQDERLERVVAVALCLLLSIEEEGARPEKLRSVML